MTRILFTSDWHLCLRNLDRAKLVVDQLVSILKRKPAHLVHCGDLVGDRGPANPIDQRVTNAVIEHVKRLKAEAQSFTFVRGNHDMIAGPDDVPSIVPLLRSLEVEAIDEPVGFALSILTGNHDEDAKLYCVPFFRDPDRQKKAFDVALEERKSRKHGKHVLVFHSAVRGCKVNHTSTGDGLTVEDIGAGHYDVCVGGHVHIAQKIPPNVWYVGSPYPGDWGEANAMHRSLLIEI